MKQTVYLRKEKESRTRSMRTYREQSTDRSPMD